MNIKYTSYVLLLFFTHFIHASPFATRLMLDNIQEQEPIQQKNPLFIQAKKCEIEFVHAYKQCLQTDDCRTETQYRQARKSAISSITDLIYYIDSLENDTDEKNEAENIKNQLIQLLEHATKR